MISLGLGTVVAGNGSSFGGFSAEYAAILTAGSGFTRPSGAEQTLQNQLIIDLKTAGIWDKLDGFYMFVNNITDSTGGFARINWKSPSSNYGTAQGSLPTITAKSGFTGSGSSAVNLNLNASTATNFSSPNGSFGVWVGTVESIGNPIMATTTNSNRIRNSSSSIISAGSVTATFSANTFIHLNKTLTTTTVYRSGTGLNGTNNTWTSDNASFCILYNGTSYGTSQIKVAFVGGDLSSLASIFNTKISDYITSVNAL